MSDDCKDTLRYLDERRAWREKGRREADERRAAREKTLWIRLMRWLGI